MRALVLGARGAVGRVVVGELRRAGDDVVPAGRTAPDGGVAIDLSSDAGPAQLRRTSAEVDVVVNASGVERPEMATDTDHTPLVEISAAGQYLRALAHTAGGSGSTVLLGAGLVPGLSTVMAATLESRPGDAIDVLAMLGSGEAHGEAAIEWTSQLPGTTLHAAPEPEPILNLRSHLRAVAPDGRARRYLRADFPDHILIGEPRGREIRTYLALSSPLATAALAITARAPWLRGALAGAPHIGSARWQLITTNRRTGETLHAVGDGQSHATGVLTALATRRLAADPPGRSITMDEIVSWPEARDHLQRRSRPQPRTATDR